MTRTIDNERHKSATSTMNIQMNNGRYNSTIMSRCPNKSPCSTINVSQQLATTVKMPMIILLAGSGTRANTKYGPTNYTRVCFNHYPGKGLYLNR